MKLETANLLIQKSPNHKGQEHNIEFLGMICYIYGHLSSKKGNDAGETEVHITRMRFNAHLKLCTKGI